MSAQGTYLLRDFEAYKVKYNPVLYSVFTLCVMLQKQQMCSSLNLIQMMTVFSHGFRVKTSHYL